MKNRGLLVFACVGNRAKVMTGQAAGARGVVTGKSGRFSEQVIVHFPKEVRTKMAVGDQIVIRAEGVGMTLDRTSGRAAEESVARPAGGDAGASRTAGAWRSASRRGFRRTSSAPGSA